MMRSPHIVKTTKSVNNTTMVNTSTNQNTYPSALNELCETAPPPVKMCGAPKYSVYSDTFVTSIPDVSTANCVFRGWITTLFVSMRT